MTDIDKQSFKITIPSIVSIIACTASVIMFLYQFRDQYTAENITVKMEIQSIKNQIQLVSIKQTNQYQSIKNDRKRDSADSKNDRLELILIGQNQ
jgi:hypothetical protein